jgi:hypothetical protein
VTSVSGTTIIVQADNDADFNVDDVESFGNFLSFYDILHITEVDRQRYLILKAEKKD